MSKSNMRVAFERYHGLGSMKDIEFAIVFDPDQLYAMAHLIFEMGIASISIE